MANQLKGRSSVPRNPNLAPPLPFSLPSVLDLGGQSGGDEEITHATGNTKNAGRANWNHQRKIYLIGLLKEYDIPRYRTNNAWSKEAWKCITDQFNLKFSTTFSVAQVKQKEQDMKKEYRVVKDLSKESGFGWDSDRKMVIATEGVWESLGARRNIESLLRWREKSFPYYDDLFILYDGRYAQGRSCHGMDHYANKAKQSACVVGSYSPPLNVPDSQMHSPAPKGSGNRDETDWFGTDVFNQVSTGENDSTFPNSVEEAQAVHSSGQEPHVPEQLPETLCMNSRPFCSTPQVAGKKRPKRQKTSSTTSTEDFHERFLQLKKEEIDRFAAIEEKKMDDPYSIKNCVTTLEGMADLIQIEDMIKAADIFKDNPANREVFLSFSSDAVRLGWLRRQI